MFSTERNFIIVFLVVFLKIDQGIYCPDYNDFFGQYKTRSAYSPGSLSPKRTTISTSWNVARTASISRDNITERSQVPGRSFSLSSMPIYFPLILEVPDYAKTFRQILSNDQYTSFVQQNDYVIIYFSSRFNAKNCQTTNNALWNLKKKEKYMNIQIYEVNKDYSSFIASQWFVESAPTLILYRNGYNVERAEGENVSTEIMIEKLFKKLLQIDDKAENETEKASEDTKKKEESESNVQIYYSRGYKYTCNGISGCKREKITSNGNESNELTEPKKDGFLNIITSLEQYKKYSQGIDYSIVFFSSRDNMDNKENCDAVKHILKDLSMNPVYEKIKIFGVDIKDCKDVADHFKIDSAPTLVSFRMENVIGTLRSNKLLDGSNTENQIESLFKSLLESKVGAGKAGWICTDEGCVRIENSSTTNGNKSNELTESKSNESNELQETNMSEKFTKIQSVEHYEKCCLTTEYAIIFFISSDEHKACNAVTKILNNMILQQCYSEVKIYIVDVKNKDLSNYFKMASAPTLRSLRQNNEVYTFASNLVQQDVFVGTMFSNLITAPAPEKPQEITTSTSGDGTPKTISASPAIRVLPKSTTFNKNTNSQGDKVMICGDCKPKTVSVTPSAGVNATVKPSTNSTTEASTKIVYNRSNLPLLDKTGILYNVRSLNSYEKYVKNTEIAVLDFSYDECSGCDKAYNILQTRMDQIETNREIILYSLNIEKCKEVAELYNVSSAPTFVFLHMGKEIERFRSAKCQSENEIQNMFNKLLELKKST